MKLWQTVCLHPLCFSLALALQCLASPIWAQTASSASADCIPFQHDSVRGGGLIVQARINDGPPLPFLIDTGSEAPILVAQWAAQMSHLHLTESTVSVGPGKLKLSVAPGQRLLIVGSDVENSLEVADAPLFVGSLGRSDRNARA